MGDLTCSQFLCWSDTTCNPILKVKATFEWPACDETIIIYVSKTNAPLIGTNFWFPFYGFLEVLNYVKATGQATVKNNCPPGNTAPGTEIGKCTKFYVTPPPATLEGSAVTTLAKEGDTPLVGDVTLSAGSGIALTQVGQDIEVSSTIQEVSLVTGTGCNAPSVDNAIQELSLVNGVLTIIGRPEHYNTGFDAYQGGMFIPTFIVTPNFNLTVAPGTIGIGPLLEPTVYPRTLCRYTQYQVIVDLSFTLGNPNAQGNGLTVVIEKSDDGGTTWIPIQREFRWMNPSDLKTSMNMHRTYVDGFDPVIIPSLPLKFRSTFESSSDNDNTIVMENIVMTSSAIIFNTDPNF